MTWWPPSKAKRRLKFSSACCGGRSCHRWDRAYRRRTVCTGCGWEWCVSFSTCCIWGASDIYKLNFRRAAQLKISKQALKKESSCLGPEGSGNGPKANSLLMQTCPLCMAIFFFLGMPSALLSITIQCVAGCGSDKSLSWATPLGLCISYLAIL